MSLGLISRSGDLKRLRDEGYEVELSNGYLLINHIPYVNGNKQVAYGTLVSTLDLVGDITARPSSHVALWLGDYPCDSKGSQLTKLVNSSAHEQIREGLVATYSFSQKPTGGYQDYYQKMTAYIRILEGEAHALDSSVASQTFPVVAIDEEESVFHYLDNASSRSGITGINEKLKGDRIAIVGLGGTGAYILDLVAKTLVAEIHLFDGDTFLQHNAFRCPGAPSCDDLTKKPTKVGWFAENYSKMRRRIIPHSQYIDERNVAELKAMTFVFICLDKGASRRIIVDYLIENKIPFIDVGMGLYVEKDALGGLVRVTTCTPSFHEHAKKQIPFGDGDEDNPYSRNIQIADLNALNATLAVIKWKKIRGFYADMENEHNTVYGVAANIVTNGEVPSETKAAQT